MSGLHPLAVVVGTHGLRGDLKIKSHLGDQAALQAASCCCLRRQQTVSDCLRIRRTVPAKGWLQISLDGVDRVEQAEALIGAEVLIDPAALRRTDGELFWFELKGLRVVDAARGPIGQLADMFETAAHAIYVVEGPYGEILIPVIPAFVGAADLEQGQLAVDVPDGLFPDQL